MKNIISILSLLLIVVFSLVAQTNSNHVYVNGYYKSDGTYVEGYYRTAPNNTNSDNFSTIGNVNPYTGKSGWITSDDSRTNYSSKTDSYTSGNRNTGSSSYGDYSTNYNNKYAGTTNASGQKVILHSNGEETFGLCDYCDNVVYSNTKEYYSYNPSDGVKKYKGRSSGTLLHGKYRFKDNNGKELSSTNFYKGLKHGYSYYWNKATMFKETIHYIYGEVDYLKFKNEDGHIIEWVGKIPEKGSVKNVYSAKGRLIQKEEIIDNLWTTKIISYYPSGSVECLYHQEILNSLVGDYIAYYENGNKKFHAKFNEEGYPIGVWTWYNEDGSFDENSSHTFREEMHSNGKSKRKGSYIFDNVENKWVKHGKWQYYTYEGSLSSVKEYDFGQLVEK